MAMWGNPHGAAELNRPVQGRHGDLSPSASKCKSRLIQISSPAHIPLQDTRWQELFLSYEILVHLDREHSSSHGRRGTDKQEEKATTTNTTVVNAAACNMAKHAAMNSNLAGYAWHVTRMLDELMHSCHGLVLQSEAVQMSSSSESPAHAALKSASSLSTMPLVSAQQQQHSHSGNASQKIALVGQARVVCGALNFFRIVVHEALVQACSDDDDERMLGDDSFSGENTRDKIRGGGGVSVNMKELFLFRRRQQQQQEGAGSDENMARGLIRSIFTFLSSLADSKPMQKLVYSTPELYDVTVFCLKLILVLCSTQLYTPIVSSYQRLENHDPQVKQIKNKNFFLDMIMQEASRRNHHHHGMGAGAGADKKHHRRIWTPQGIMVVCLHWIIHRPRAPERSLTYHFQTTAEMIAKEIKNEKVGVDGMYESHTVVMANAPSHDPVPLHEEDDDANEGEKPSDHEDDARGASHHDHRSSSGMILDSTKKMIHLSSTLFLLPIRLLVVALRALRNSQRLILGGGKGLDYDASRLAEFQSLYSSRMSGAVDDLSNPSLTNDVLWLTHSPLADLGSCLLLILTNNHRAGVEIEDGDGCYSNNPFRMEMASMDDNRWEGYSDVKESDGYLGEATDIFETVDLSNNGSSFDRSMHHYRNPKQSNLMTVNFEHLFHSFGGTLHTEVGALVLYTVLQASPIFAASLAVRSDLDKLVLPLLRTLYFSTSISSYISGRTTTYSNDGNSVNVLEQPFRSRSQLYVIMILLLIFSQDASFGPDAFKRSNIPSIEWYKERKLKNMSIGSVLILSILRCITFNLNRLYDPFLLSNCCAVLLNLSPHVVELNSYTALRLVGVLVATMKRYAILVMKNGGKPAEDGDVTSTLGMYAEACRILLQVVKQGVRRKVVESNLHLVYALAYNQREFNTILKSKSSPFLSADTIKIRAVMEEAEKIIQQAPNRTAESSMLALREHVQVFKSLRESGRRKRSNSSSSSISNDSTMSDSTMNGMEDFKFTYEEESDPEIFFIPYVWEVIVCTITSSSLEWDKEHIQVFPIMHHVAPTVDDSTAINYETNDTGDMLTTRNKDFSKDVDDIV